MKMWQIIRAAFLTTCVLLAMLGLGALALFSGGATLFGLFNSMSWSAIATPAVICFLSTFAFIAIWSWIHEQI
jgi:hypothetical protein